MRKADRNRPYTFLCECVTSVDELGPISIAPPAGPVDTVTHRWRRYAVIGDLRVEQDEVEEAWRVTPRAGLTGEQYGYLLGAVKTAMAGTLTEAEGWKRVGGIWHCTVHIPARRRLRNRRGQHDRQ